MTSLDFTTVAVAVPLDVPTRIATRELTKRDYVIVRVQDDSGNEGVGYTYAGTNAGASTAHFIDEVLVPVAAAADDIGIVETWEAMYRDSLLVGRRGLALRAMSAVDLALWDLAARRAGIPLATYLGGGLKQLPAYASGGYYRSSDGPWASAAFKEIESNKAHGFVDHKIKVGGLTIAEDAERVRAAIDAMAGQGRLAVDANNAYTSPADALRALRSFEEAAGDCGLWWFEEPLSPDDISGLELLQRKATTPIATGEISQTRHDFRMLLDSSAADILQPDVGVLGGVTEFMRVLRAAETYQYPVAPHWHANVHVHLMAAASTSLTIEHFLLDKDIFNFEKLILPTHRLAFDNGHVAPPDRPGLGVEFDRAALREWAVWGEAW